MKKLLFCIAVMSLTTFVFAGSGFAGFGPKFGLNIANVRGDSIPDEYESKMAFNFGVFTTYNINDFIGVQPELMFTMKGSKAEGEIMGESYTSKLNLNYIEIPILAKLTIPLGSVRPYVVAGPEFAFNMTATVSSEYAGQDTTVDIEDASVVDFGMMFGGGVAFELGPGFLSLEAKYDMGFLPIADEEEDAYNAYNNCLSINLGYAFGR